jgi:hypothetical protein
MQDALPELGSSAQKLWAFISRQANSKAAIKNLSLLLQDTGSREYKALKRLIPGYTTQKEVYGTEYYINVPAAISTILPSQLFRNTGDGPWRPDGILYFANLAQFISGVLCCVDNEERLRLLENTERDYPNQFMSRVVEERSVNWDMGCSALGSLTLEGGIYIRTQLYILKIQKRLQEPGFDPATSLAEIFYNSGDALKGFGSDGLRTEELPDPFKRKIAKVTSRLNDLINEDAGFESVNLEYSWSKAVVKLVLWAQARKEELESQLVSHGGFEGVYDTLLAEIKKREGLQTVEDASTVETERREGMQLVRNASPGDDIETR